MEKKQKPSKVKKLDEEIEFLIEKNRKSIKVLSKLIKKVDESSGKKDSEA